MQTKSDDKRFLCLQGPHGPFFYRLAKMLRAAGSQVWRVGFNAGDHAFWFGSEGYIPFKKTHDQWPETVKKLLETHQITDIILYGDTRKIHAQAIEIASQKGINIHVFEEGYMRPYWVTYERGGSNGNSRLIDLNIEQMQRAIERSDLEVPTPPSHWGDMRQHIFYGALYHWFVMFKNGHYKNFTRHRELPVSQEFKLYLKRLLLMPIISIKRRISSAKIKHGGYPYHLVLMQLEHDSSFQIHSPFTQMKDFIERVVDGFSKGAPRHHHLVFKAHPLENDRSPTQRIIKDLARQYGLTKRIHYIRGGKLAPLLNNARTAVTVNSTAGQQVLWRGIPLKVFGKAVYAKPEFVSEQSLPEFFHAPQRPNLKAYRDYRRFLLETSQIPGGFYSTHGRRQLLREVVDMILAERDPYDALQAGGLPPRQPLRIVSS